MISAIDKEFRHHFKPYPYFQECDLCGEEICKECIYYYFYQTYNNQPPQEAYICVGCYNLKKDVYPLYRLPLEKMNTLYVNAEKEYSTWKNTTK